MATESPIFTKSYELLRWLIPMTLKFPRQQRFVLAAALQHSALQLHERLIEAVHQSAEAAATLTRANVEVDKLRHYLRLCHDCDLITSGQFEHGARLLVEIGRLLGGWRKALDRRQSAQTARPTAPTTTQTQK